MNKKTKIGNINDLQAARLSAGLGIDVISFSSSVTESHAKEIQSWLAGVVCYWQTTAYVETELSLEMTSVNFLQENPTKKIGVQLETISELDAVLQRVEQIQYIVLPYSAECESYCTQLTKINVPFFIDVTNALDKINRENFSHPVAYYLSGENDVEEIEKFTEWLGL